MVQPYLPDQTNIPYRLRTRPHNKIMINKTKFLNDTDFKFVNPYVVLDYWINIHTNIA